MAEDDPRVEVAGEAWDLTAEQRARLSTPLTCVTDGAAKLLAVGDRHEGDAALEPGLASAGLWETPEHKPAPAARVRHRGHRAADEAARLHVAMVERTFGEERAAERDIDLGGRSLREHTARGALINAAFFTGLAAISLGRRFGVAVFLTAADYGLWGLIYVAVATVLWLKDVGIADKFVQQDEDDQEVAFHKAFTLNILWTLAFCLLIAVLAPVFALVYGQPEIIVPVCVMALGVFATAL